MCENERWKFEKLRCSDLVVGCGMGGDVAKFYYGYYRSNRSHPGGTKDGSKGYNSHHSEYDKIYLL